MRLFRGHFIAVALMICASPALTACGVADIKPPGSIPAAPSAIADKTTMDEKALLGLELGYHAARTLAEFGVDMGLIKGEFASRVRKINADVNHWLEIARGAYDSGNAVTYGMALDYAKPLITELLSLGQKGEKP